MSFLSYSSYDIPGFAPHMVFLFLGQRDFPISLSSKDTLRDDLTRHYFRKLYCRYEYLNKQYEFPLSRRLNNILKLDHKWHPILIKFLTPSHDLITLTWLSAELPDASTEHFRRMFHANRESLIRTPGPVLFGICMCASCWNQTFSPLFMIFRTLHFETLSV